MLSVYTQETGKYGRSQSSTMLVKNSGLIKTVVKALHLHVRTQKEMNNNNNNNNNNKT